MRAFLALLRKAAMLTGSVVLICKGVTLDSGVLALLGAVMSVGFVASSDYREERKP